MNAPYEPLSTGGALARSRDSVLDPRQTRIYERLSRIGSGPAGFFRDACFLIERPETLLTTPHMVAHALRETESALRNVLLATLSIEVPPGGDDRHRREIVAILGALSLPAEDPAAQAWLSIPSKEAGLQARAHRRNLERRVVDEDFRELWEQVQLFLDVVLEMFEVESVRSFNIVDDLVLQDPPTNAGVSSFLQNVIRSNPVLDHFAERAPVSWVGPLAESGFLTQAPSIDDTGPNASYAVLRWPMVKLLARAALDVDKRDEAVGVALELAAVPNPVLHLELCDFALSLPPDLAARFTGFAHAWLHPPAEFLLVDRLTKLARYLTDGGEHEAAFGLTEALLLAGTEGSQSTGTPAAQDGTTE